MRILVIDEDRDNSKKIYNCFVNDRGYEVDLSITLEDTVSVYRKNKYGMVVIDFATRGGKRSLEYIVGVDPTQKIITQSGIEECSELKGCDYCVQHYNKRRLVKQCSATDILNIIDKFDTFSCYYQNSFR